MNQKDWKNNFAFVLLVYLSAHVLMLLSNGVWWDDFVIWNVPPEMLFNQLGPDRLNSPVQYAYINFVVSHFPLYQQMYIFHLVEFMFHGISLVCCWFILKAITSNKTFTTMCCSLMASYGLDSTSLLLTCSHYSIANCLFFAGLLVVVKEFYSGRKYLLYIAGGLWLISLLVWRSAALLMPLVLLFFSCANNEGAWRTIYGWGDIIKYIFVHYLPIITIVGLFIPCYLIFMQPSGQYGVYYTPKIHNIIISPFTSFICAIMAVILAIGTSVKSLGDSGSLLILCMIGICVFIVYWFVKKYISEGDNDAQSYKSLAKMALIYLMFSMILPLWIYSFFEVVDISEYKSRLLSLGAFPTAVIITYILFFFPKRVRNISFALVLVGMATYTTYTYINYAYAWNKTEIISDYFKQNPEFDGKDIYIIDHAFEANENKSNLRYYAYEGMARMAYGADTKTRVESKYNEYYGKTFQPDYIVYCSPSYFPIKIINKCELIIGKWLFKRKYQQLKNEMLLIKHERCDSGKE